MKDGEKRKGTDCLLTKRFIRRGGSRNNNVQPANNAAARARAPRGDPGDAKSLNLVGRDQSDARVGT